MTERGNEDLSALYKVDDKFFLLRPFSSLLVEGEERLRGEGLRCKRKRKGKKIYPWVEKERISYVKKKGKCFTMNSEKK